MNKKLLIVEMGQSNMEGRYGDNPLHTSPVGTAYYTNGLTVTHLLNNRGGATGGSHATYFANKLHDLTAEKPIMMEAASGASGLTAASSNVNNNWSATGTLRLTTQSMIQSAISNINEILAPTCALWCQGEQDGLKMDNDPLYTFAIVKTAMQDVIDWWQGLYPGVPFLISQTGRPNAGDTTGYANMRSIQQQIVDENTDVYMAFTGAVGFPAAGKMADNVHYNFEGYQDMGEAFGLMLSQIIN